MKQKQTMAGWLPALVVGAALFGALPAAQAAIPELFNVQGVLRSSDGMLVDGQFTLHFSLYDAETEGTVLWVEEQADVLVQVGVFSAYLGADSGNPLPVEALYDAGEVWVEVAVGEEVPLPRQRLVSAPFSLAAQRALSADTAAALSCTGCVSDTALDFDPATQGELDALAANPLAQVTCTVGYGLAYAAEGWQCTPLADGDITGVTAGTGLTGGGVAGNVSVAILAGGVTSTLVADGTLTDADISATAAIAQSKIAGTIGDVTGLTAGTGLTGGGTAGNLTVSLMSCTANQLLQSAGATWGCVSAAYDAERLGGQSEAAYFRLDQGETVTGIPAFNGGTTGASAPFTVDSATVVANLNADLLDGFNAASFAPAVPRQLPRANLISVVDNRGLRETPGLTIGADGLPVVAFKISGANDLAVAKCANVACSAGTTAATVDSTGDVGSHVSAATGPDGFPVISYYDVTNTALKVAKCGNAACTSGNTLTTVDAGAPDAGTHTAITHGTDGLPVIAYYDITNTDLRVAKCDNAACSGTNTLTSVDASANDVGGMASIALGFDGLPIIAYNDVTNLDCKVAKCLDAACTTSTLTTVGPAGRMGYFIDIAIGADGLPLVAYYNASGAVLMVTHCGNESCTAGNVDTSLDGDAYAGWGGIALTVTPDGLPLVAYLVNNANPRVAKCRDAECTTRSARVTIDTGSTGFLMQFVTGVDGLPLALYHPWSGADFKALHCGSPNCVPFWTSM